MYIHACSHTRGRTGGPREPTSSLRKCLFIVQSHRAHCCDTSGDPRFNCPRVGIRGSARGAYSLQVDIAHAAPPPRYVKAFGRYCPALVCKPRPYKQSPRLHMRIRWS